MNINVLFSNQDTADDKIKRMFEASVDPKNTVLVSDDKEIIFFVKSGRGKTMSVEDFIKPALKYRHKVRTSLFEKELMKPELNYMQVNKINQELKKIWCK
jgi:hypothetical protein